MPGRIGGDCWVQHSAKFAEEVMGDGFIFSDWISYLLMNE